MNNTTTLAIVAVLTAATLVVGGTLGATTSVFAYQKKGESGSKNGNTVTIQKCKQDATQSGFDNNQEQECENLICTHPGENVTCSQEIAAVQQGNQTTPTTGTINRPDYRTTEESSRIRKNTKIHWRSIKFDTKVNV